MKAFKKLALAGIFCFAGTTYALQIKYKTRMLFRSGF